MASKLQAYAQIKALCAGNPLIKEKMDLDIDVARLRLLKSDHQSHQYRMEDDLLKRFPEKIKENEGFIAGLEADMKTLAEHPHPMVPVKPAAPPQADGEQPDAPAADAPAAPAAETAAVEVKQGFAGMVIGDQTFTDKIEAGKALIAEIRKGIKPGEPVEIGTYRGFSMALSVEDFGRTIVLTLKGQMSHRAELGDDVLGNLLRIDHALNKMPDRVTALHSQLKYSGAVSESTFMVLTQKNEQERLAKAERLDALLSKVDKAQQKTAAIQNWTAIIRKYLNLQDLDRTTIDELIDHIKVGERTVVDGQRRQDIKVFYRFVGLVE